MPLPWLAGIAGALVACDACVVTTHPARGPNDPFVTHEEQRFHFEEREALLRGIHCADLAPTCARYELASPVRTPRLYSTSGFRWATASGEHAGVVVAMGTLDAWSWDGAVEVARAVFALPAAPPRRSGALAPNGGIAGIPAVVFAARDPATDTVSRVALVRYGGHDEWIAFRTIAREAELRAALPTADALCARLAVALLDGDASRPGVELDGGSP